MDVFHRDLTAEEVLVVLHLGEHIVELLFPAALVLLEDLVDTVLKEYPLK